MACCSIPSMTASSAAALQAPRDRVCFTKPCPDLIRMPCLRGAVVKAQATGGDGNVKVQQQQKSNNAVQQQQQQQRQPQQQWNTRNRQSTPLTPFDSWDPFMPASKSFSQMMDVMNQMLDGVSATGTAGPTTMQRRSTARVPWDVLEDDEGFNMRVDMPGLAKEEVKVFIDDGVLVIKGEVSAERREKDKWAARSGGSYESRVAIPDNVEVEQIKAELKDGVLYVVVPKKKVEPKKPIDIKVS